jgi:RND family efflux transporter MFP subunit
MPPGQNPTLRPPRDPAHPGPDEDLPVAGPRAVGIAVGAVSAVLVAVLVVGSAARVTAGQRLHRETVANAIETVSYTNPKPVAGTTLTLPARIDAWYQAPVYARTTGYLRKWYVDIGSRVHAGQVMADIETPEVDQELVAARAALQTAQAQLDLAEITAARWTKLLSQDAVSRQEAQNRQGDYAARLAMRNQAAAEVSRLEALTSFKQLVAPFDGVVTSRATDIGDLIVAGAGGSAPLFTVSDISRLRVYVSVPQPFIAAVVRGTTANFTVPEIPGRNFTAEVVRTAQAVDPASDAMLVQLVYDNADRVLKPGSYADLRFDLPQAARAGLMTIPADALLFRSDGTTVAVAGPDDRVRIVPVHIATDLGTMLEITSTLGPDDRVIDSPSEAIGPGDHVRATPRQANRTPA